MSKLSHSYPPAALGPNAVVAQMIEWRLKSQSELAKLIGKTDVADRAAFSLSIRFASGLLGGLSELAREFDASPSAVGRWASGKNLPAIHARRVILERIIQKLQSPASPPTLQ